MSLESLNALVGIVSGLVSILTALAGLVALLRAWRPARLLLLALSLFALLSGLTVSAWWLRPGESAGPAKPGSTLARIAELSPPGHPLAVCPGTGTVLVGGEDGSVRVRDFNSGRELLCYRGHGRPVVALACSPDGGRVVSTDGGDTLHLWQQADGRELRLFDVPGAALTRVAFLPGGDKVICGGRSGRVHVLDLDTGEVASYRGHEAAARFGGFLPGASCGKGLPVGEE